MGQFDSVGLMPLFERTSGRPEITVGFYITVSIPITEGETAINQENDNGELPVSHNNQQSHR
jgi:hypothetical protein